MSRKGGNPDILKFRWTKGQSGNPSGLKKGYKYHCTLVKEAMLKAFKNGEFEEWARKNQTDYYKILASILPKDLDIEDVSGRFILVCKDDPDKS